MDIADFPGVLWMIDIVMRSKILWIDIISSADMGAYPMSVCLSVPQPFFEIAGIGSLSFHWTFLIFELNVQNNMAQNVVVVVFRFFSFYFFQWIFDYQK